MNRMKPRLLFFLLLSFFALFLLCRPEKAVPAAAVSPLRRELRTENGLTVYVDGTRLSSPCLSVAGEERHYVPAAEFLAALDSDFWAEEKDQLSYTPLPHAGKIYLCVEDFCSSHGISTYRDGEGTRLWCTSAAGDWEPPAGLRVPVLMYHGVGDDLWPGESLVVRTEELERQLALLLERGYTPIWFSDLKHADRIEKPILLTFDDGYRDNYTELFPLLQKYGVKATVFIVSGFLGNEHTLTLAQMRQMQDSGLVSFQCHTQYHLDLDSLDYEEQIKELCWSKVALLELTDREPYVIAYPRGRQNEETLAICRKDYRFGVKMGGAPYVTGDDPLLIHRIGIYRSTSLEEFSARFP